MDRGGPNQHTIARDAVPLHLRARCQQEGRGLQPERVRGSSWADSEASSARTETGAELSG